MPFKPPNYKLTISSPGVLTGNTLSNGNPEFGPATVAIVYASIHQANQQSLNRLMFSHGVKHQDHIPMIGGISIAGTPLPDGSLAPTPNELPSTFRSGEYVAAENIRSGVKGKMQLYLRGRDMSERGYQVHTKYVGTPIYGNLKIQEG